VALLFEVAGELFEEEVLDFVVVEVLLEALGGVL
jgi:hypothetical protein